MKKVAIDLDNTFWNLTDTWLTYYNRMFYDDLDYKDIKEYDITRYAKKCSVENLFFILSLEHFWKDVKPYPDAIYYLNKINEEFELYIATNSSENVIRAKKFKRFMELCPFIKDEQIIKIANKQLLNVDYLVDDYEQNLIGGKYNKILITQPYNIDFHNEDYEIERCYNLRSVYELIKKEENI